MSGPVSQTTNGELVVAMQPPLDIRKNLRFAKFRAMRIEAVSQGLNQGLLLVGDPPLSTMWIKRPMNSSGHSTLSVFMPPL